ncbi:tRNA (adenosine(37)-N6)-dimethylallyltransferase MiaA [Dyadobacter arcticus]|uniref:tRNA dimethylallyltransferase n=1 Tax=Dyadobacter arcticus TaxID=1078754 RepID=A0ABX0UT89_9BACT|nr:tRNA (adenosine(37)-N6)-dimethylallyltransferase MiaA [Dyadobacter arcticus]NIJ54186.1 tRNA dimethylallyltransferase [Dyadobacter arcticus]
MNEQSKKSPLLIILGPTASGKTQLAVQVALRINGEILSADSRQVYRDMDIGTGKDLNEYTVEGITIPYHLINILDAGGRYNVNDFQHDFEKVCQQIISVNHVPIVCGGTGFYIYSLLKGHAYASIPVDDPLRNDLETLPNEALVAKFRSAETAYYRVADISTRKRLIRAIEIADFLIANPDEQFSLSEQSSDYDAIIFGLNPNVEVRRDRITHRLNQRLQNGMVEEVQRLLNRGLSKEQLVYYGLEYKYITQYLTGEIGYNSMKIKLETEIHRFAKRQMTFFRKMEKDGFHINWLSEEMSQEEKIRLILDRYREFKSKLAGI